MSDITPLQQRAKAFLERPIPPEMAKHYVSGSITDIIIANFVAKATVDRELRELLTICETEVHAAAERHATKEAKDYYHECGEILAQIQAEQRRA